jgi:RNA polymerase sigma factor (sigma-70 family)
MKRVYRKMDSSAVMNLGPTEAEKILGWAEASLPHETARPGTTFEASGNSAFIPTRDSLLSRLKDSTAEDSWREFFETYWKLIYETARKEGLNDQEAQDVVQETMITLTRHIAEFKKDIKLGSFKTWLMRLTQTKIIDQFRKRQAADELGSSLAPEQVLEFQSNWDRDWQVNAAEEAMRRVQNSARPKMFQAYSVCVLQGRGPRIAAKLVKMSLPAVYLAVFKVRRKIQSEMKKLQKGQF